MVLGSQLSSLFGIWLAKPKGFSSRRSSFPRSNTARDPGQLRADASQKNAELASAPLVVITEHSARGLDFKRIDAVFLVGLPKRVESYIHVAGRTAREGRKGRAVSLLTDEKDVDRLSAFGRELGVRIETVDVRFLKGS